MNYICRCSNEGLGLFSPVGRFCHLCSGAAFVEYLVNSYICHRFANILICFHCKVFLSLISQYRNVMHTVT